MTLDSELPRTLGEVLKRVSKILAMNPVIVERRLVETEAEQIVSSAFRKVTGVALSRVDLHSQTRDPFPAAAARIAVEMAQDRSEGSILQHLTGVQEFLGREYDVGPDVLIPRPETEFLAFVALEHLKGRSLPPALGFEIGLGSGILSIELLAHFSGLEMWATEVSDAAVTRAQANAAKILGVRSSRLHVLRPVDAGDVWSPFRSLGRAADFIISNPPYLSSDDEIDADVRAHEPASALYAPPADVLHFYREISAPPPSCLSAAAMAFLEIPHERGREIAALFAKEAWYTEIIQDLTGRDRVLVAKRERPTLNG
jgi:release factor glutamine methyltransferase